MSTQSSQQLTCQTCGHVGPLGRFCGGCGKRTDVADEPDIQAVRSRSSQPTDADDDFEALVPTRGGRRWVLALAIVVITVATSIVALRQRDSADRVVNGWDRTAVTSLAAATDLSNELWRARVPHDSNDRFLTGVPVRVTGVTSQYVLADEGFVTGVYERSSGRRVNAMSLGGGELDPPLDEDRLTVWSQGAIVTVSLSTGRILERVPVEGTGGVIEGGGNGRQLSTLGDAGYLLVGGGETRRLDVQGTTRWRHRTEPEEWIVAAEAAEGAVVISAVGSVRVLDLETGDLLWSLEELSGGLLGSSGPAVVDSGRVYLTDSWPGAYDLRTGEEIWRAVGMPAQVIAEADGVLFATSFSQSNVVHRFDAASGEPLSPVTLPGGAVPAETLHESGLVTEELVIGTTGSSTVAIEFSGTERWRVYGTAPQRVPEGIAITQGRTIRVVDDATGEVINEVVLERSPPPTQLLAPVTVSGRGVWLPGGHIVDLATGAPLADVNGASGWPSGLPVEDGFVAPTLSGPAVVNLHGQMRWSLTDPTFGISSHPAPIGDLMAVNRVRGELILVDPATGERVGDAQGTTVSVQATDGTLALGVRDTSSGPPESTLTVLRRDADDLTVVSRMDMLGGVPTLWNGEILDVGMTRVTRRSADDGEVLGAFTLEHIAQEWALGLDTFAFASGHQVAGIDPRSGEQRWLWQPEVLVTSPPIIAGELVYVGTLDGRVHLLDLADGRVVDTVQVGDSAVSQVLVTSGVLLARVDDEVVALGPEPESLQLPPMPPRGVGDIILEAP